MVCLTGQTKDTGLARAIIALHTAFSNATHAAGIIQADCQQLRPEIDLQSALGCADPSAIPAWQLCAAAFCLRLLELAVRIIDFVVRGRTLRVILELRKQRSTLF